MSSPVLIDLFCRAGGASAGYQRAGFQVVGVDIEYQPVYPYEQIAADVTKLDLGSLIESVGAVAIHASPPCQRYSRLRHYQPDTIEARYDDLIGKTRELLEPTGLPYVIENVELAKCELIDPVMLCGSQFDLEMVRHRMFEVSGFDLSAPPHFPKKHLRCVRGGYLPAPGQGMTIQGGKHSKAWQRRACQAMGTPWMSYLDGDDLERATRDVCEAIPPVYAEFVGRHLMAGLRQELAA